MGSGSQLNESDLAQELADVSGVKETDSRWHAAMRAISAMRKSSPRDVEAHFNPEDPNLVRMYLALSLYKKKNGGAR